MKATVNPSFLLKGLKKMSGIVRENHIVPIASAVLLSFENELLTITATDLESTYVSKIPCSGKDNFSFPIDYFDILEFCSSVFAPITIELKGVEILIKSDKSKFKLSVAGQANEFPKIPVEEYTYEMDVDGEFFFHLGRANSCRWKVNNLNPSLDMAAVLIRKDELDIVGCDSLIMYKKNIKKSSEKELSVMVCEKFTLLCKSFQETKISIGERFIKAEFNDEIIISRLSEAKYVNIKAILPATIEYNMTLSKEDLRLGLSAISVASNIASKQFVIDFKDDGILFTSQNFDYEKEAETKIETKHAVPFDTIRLNSTQLLHLSTLVDTEEIDFYFQNPSSNVYMKPKGDDSVLMLIRPYVTT